MSPLAPRSQCESGSSRALDSASSSLSFRARRSRARRHGSRPRARRIVSAIPVTKTAAPSSSITSATRPSRIDVAFWFMEDARYTTELILRWRAGVPVRVLIDPRANADYPLNAQRLAELQTAGIPDAQAADQPHPPLEDDALPRAERGRVQRRQLSAPTPGGRGPRCRTRTTSTRRIYFTSDTSIVNSFRTRFDDQWVDTVSWANYANVNGPLLATLRHLPEGSVDELRAVGKLPDAALSAYNAERRKIDVIMYRITDRAHADSMLAAVYARHSRTAHHRAGAIP